MYTTEVQTTVTCPNCHWMATGDDVQALNAAKDHHATFQCPDDGAIPSESQES